MTTNNLRRKNRGTGDTSSPAQRIIFPEPQTELARLALEARRRYLESSELLLTLKEISKEVNARRGGERHADE